MPDLADRRQQHTIRYEARPHGVCRRRTVGPARAWPKWLFLKAQRVNNPLPFHHPDDLFISPSMPSQSTLISTCTWVSPWRPSLRPSISTPAKTATLSSTPGPSALPVAKSTALPLSWQQMGSTGLWNRREHRRSPSALRCESARLQSPELASPPTSLEDSAGSF